MCKEIRGRTKGVRLTTKKKRVNLSPKPLLIGPNLWLLSFILVWRQGWQMPTLVLTRAVFTYVWELIEIGGIPVTMWVWDLGVILFLEGLLGICIWRWNEYRPVRWLLGNRMKEKREKDQGEMRVVLWIVRGASSQKSFSIFICHPGWLTHALCFEIILLP